MFASVMAECEDRVHEVDVFFALLRAVESNTIKPRPGTGPSLPPEWIRILKGTAYLVLYNLVEAFVRRGFEAIFESIKSDKLCGIDLTATLRDQWIMQKNREVKAFDGSPKVYMRIAGEIVREISGKKVAYMQKHLLPFPGNLDAESIRKVCSNHGVTVTLPPASKGGGVIKRIKQKRNALGHGDESFAECGRAVTVADLVQTKREIVLYMRGLLQSLKDFSDSKGYKA